jgi:hypothetical protein
MRYMLWMIGDGRDEPGPAEILEMPEFVAWQKAMDERGVQHHGARLRPPHTAATVRVRNGEVLVTDGPFADTKEVFAGYYLIEADDLDGALEVAARVPAARMGGGVEVRPFMAPPS